MGSPRDPVNVFETDSLDVSEGATRRVSDLTKQFDEMLWTAAQQHAKRRGSNCLDNTDFDAAFRELANPRYRPLTLDIMAEIGLFVSGALLGYASTLLTQATPLTGPGTVMVLAGLGLGAFSAVVKHIKLGP